MVRSNWDMTFKEGKYNIKAVSKKLGIRPGTLRAWERRYQVIDPVRNESGHRLYTEQHVVILQWLIGKVNEGFTIKQAVDLMDTEDEARSSSINESDFYIKQFAEELVEALIDLDEVKAQHLLNQAYSLYSLDRVTIEVMLLAQKYVKEKKRESVYFTDAHESFLLFFLETKITAIMQTLPVDPQMPKALLLCRTNEEDALLLRIFSFYLKRKGMNVLCFGAGISDEDVELLVEQWKPDLFVISCMNEKNIEKTQDILERYDVEPTRLTTGFLGDSFITLSDQEKKSLAPYYIGKSRADWEQWLERSN